KSFGALSVVPATREQIVQLLEGKLADDKLAPDGQRPEKVALFHFAGHGEFDPDVAFLSRIVLEDNDLHVADVDRYETALGDQGTVVFLNACQSGQTARPFGMVGGWAQA